MGRTERPGLDGLDAFPHAVCFFRVRQRQTEWKKNTDGRDGGPATRVPPLPEAVHTALQRAVPGLSTPGPLLVLLGVSERAQRHHSLIGAGRGPSQRAHPWSLFSQTLAFIKSRSGGHSIFAGLPTSRLAT